MQFQVPQFIEFEDKIVGPMTIKQFGYVAGGGALCFLLFFVLKTSYAITFSIPIAAASLTLAFGKVKGIPVPKYLMSMVVFSLRPQMYLWRKK